MRYSQISIDSFRSHHLNWDHWLPHPYCFCFFPLLIFLDLHSFIPVFPNQTALGSIGFALLVIEPFWIKVIFQAWCYCTDMKICKPSLATSLCWVMKSMALGIIAAILWIFSTAAADASVHMRGWSGCLLILPVLLWACGQTTLGPGASTWIAGTLERTSFLYTVPCLGGIA